MICTINAESNNNNNNNNNINDDNSNNNNNVDVCTRANRNSQPLALHTVNIVFPR